jgi:hypothetical protein
MAKRDRQMMKRLAPCLILALLAACETLAPRPDAGRQAEVTLASDASPPVVAAQPGLDRVGRAGPDGAPPIVAPAVADRGIGGTGAPVAMATAIQTVERGIGGTGIVGVVTGFGSVFVNGIEVEYDASVSVDIDGNASSVSALRAGQLVAIQAEGPADSPHARMISVRSAVTGRIEALELGSGMLTIAGQAVTVPDGTWGANHFGLGDWVTVSGLRRGDGTIVASRLDVAPAGTLLARGRVVRDGDVVRVGTLELTGPVAAGVKEGQFVVVSGAYAAGRGHISTIASDTLWPSPAAYFGSATNQLVVQAFVRVDKGSVSMNGIKVRSESVVSGRARQDGMAVVSLQRERDGSYTAIGLRYSDYRGHTERPARGGGGAGTGDSSQAPQRNAHAAAPQLPQQSAGDSVSAANLPPATIAMAGGPLSPERSPPPAQTPATVVSTPGPATASSSTDDAASQHATPVSLVSKPVTTPSTTPSTEPATSPPVVTPTQPTTSQPVATPSPPVATPSPPAAATPTQPAPLSAPFPQGFPGPISSIGGSGNNPSPVWAPARLPAAFTGHVPTRSGPLAVTGSVTTPTISLLTGAVTSVTTTVPGTIRAASVSVVTPLLSASASKSTTTIGTTSGKQTIAGRTRSGGH